MKIDFSSKILDIEGNVIPVSPGAESPVTLGTVALQSLLGVYEDERNLAGDEKARRFKLALIVNKGGVAELSVEDIAQIKKLIGKAYAPMIVGRAYEIIESTNAE